MTNKDLISQYVDTGIGIPEYQFNKLSNNDKKTYLRKMQISIKNDTSNIKYYYGELPEDIQLIEIQFDVFNIRYLKNPTEKVQMIAVKKNTETLEWIEKPTEAVQLAAIDKNYEAIGFIQNPTEKAQMAAVNKNGNAIQYINNPTKRVIKLHNQLY